MIKSYLIIFFLLFNHFPGLRAEVKTTKGESLNHYIAECSDCNLIIFSYSALATPRLSMYGHEKETDPETKNFVKDGIIFDNHYAVSNWPYHSQISLYTGRLPINHGVMNNGFHNRIFYPGLGLKEDKISDSHETLAELARRNGYQTFFLGGSPHNKFYSPESGVTRGIDRYIDHCLHNHSEVTEVKNLMKEQKGKKFFGIINSVRTHFPHFLTPKTFQTEFTKYRYRGFFPSNEEELQQEMKGGWKDLMSFLQSNPSISQHDFVRSRRFANDDFWFLNTARIIDGRKGILHYLNIYDQAIRYTDFFIGEIFRALEESGQREKTIVLITSDIGANSFEEYKGGPEPSFGYGTISPESTRIPLIISHPQLRAKGTGLIRYSGITNTTDLYPTIASMLGWKNRTKEIDGADLLTASTGDRLYTSSFTYRPHRGMTVAYHNEQGSYVISKQSKAYFDRATKSFLVPESFKDYKRFKNLHSLKKFEASARKLVNDPRYPNLNESKEGKRSKGP